MTKRTVFIIFIYLLSCGASLSAEDLWNVTFGTYLESEINTNKIHRDSDLHITPALTSKISNTTLPLYLKIEMENRKAGEYYFNDLDYQGGHKIRQKLMFGGSFGQKSVIFKPEYELRIDSSARGEYLESNLENRFKLNFLFPVASNSIYIDLMPTWKVFSESDNNFYQESEAGFKYSINRNQSAALAIYNSFENKKSLNAFEFQARIYYNYKFKNGISLNPFARIGLSRQIISSNETKINLRRDRLGLKIAQTVENGLAPYAEFWYQHTNDTEDQNQHTILWKIGLSYSF